jgi:hypothetical protein
MTGCSGALLSGATLWAAAAMAAPPSCAADTSTPAAKVGVGVGMPCDDRG